MGLTLSVIPRVVLVDVVDRCRVRISKKERSKKDVEDADTGGVVVGLGIDILGDEWEG